MLYATADYRMHCEPIPIPSPHPAYPPVLKVVRDYYADAHSAWEPLQERIETAMCAAQ